MSNNISNKLYIIRYTFKINWQKKFDKFQINFQIDCAFRDRNYFIILLT